jgi:cold-inducible RNA-binding protein
LRENRTIILRFQRSIGASRSVGLEASLEKVNELSKKIYVGNLSFQTTEEQVRELFEEHGTIESLAWITDRDTGRPRGFAFVEMEDSSAIEAIKALNGQMLDGRELRVNEARPKTDSRRGGGSRGGGKYNRRR